MENSKVCHVFNVEDAVKHGVEKAIILYNIRFWLDKNKANRQGVRDGYYWTYNSASAFAELFPYLHPRSITRWLTELEASGVLKSSDTYNKSKFDKTKWYTIPSEYSTSQSDSSIGQNGESKGQNDATIPDVNTDVSTDMNTSCLFDTFWASYPRHDAKAMAKRAFDKAIRKATLDELLKAIAAQRESTLSLRNGGKYIPMASSWLNAERWQDEVKAVDTGVDYSNGF